MFRTNKPSRTASYIIRTNLENTVPYTRLIVRKPSAFVTSLSGCEIVTRRETQLVPSFMSAGVNIIKHHPASSYTIWLMSTMWRRKTSILALVVLTVLLVICLQYNVTKEIVEITLSRQESDAEDAAERNKAMPLRSHVRSVQFSGEEQPYATRDNTVNVVGRNGEYDYNRRRGGGDYGLVEGAFKGNVEVSCGTRRREKLRRSAN